MIDSASSPSGQGSASSDDPGGNRESGGSAPGASRTAARTALRTIFEDGDAGPSEKIESALRLGTERLGVENAHLSRIDLAEATRTVRHAVGPHPKIAPGTTTPLSATYCREAIARQAPLLIPNAAEADWTTDPAYEHHGFSTYLGAKVLVDGTLYGTVCFVDESPHPDLTTADNDFLKRLAAEIGDELASPGASPALVTPRSLSARIQEVAGVGAWVYDADTDTVTGTDALYRLLEMPEDEEFDLATGLSFYPSDVRPDVEAAVQDCLENGSPIDLTVPLVTAKEARRWVRVRGRRHQRNDGGIRMTGTLQDVTEQKQMEETLEEERSVLRRMYRITADREASFDGKIERLLELGCQYLDLPYGFLTRIEDGTQHIMHAQGTHPLLQRGASCPLSESYCRRTIQEESLLAVQDVLSAGWTDDPAVEKFELGSYIGAKVLVENDLYGTFCFAAHDVRDASFSDSERTFVELLSRWASYELEQKRATERLERQNERLDRFASVVSHDLRNPLNVAQGRLQLIREQFEALDSDDTGEIEDHLAAVGRAHTRIDTIIEDMLALTWSGQALEDIDTEPVRLRDVAEESWEQVATAEAHLHVAGDRSLRADKGRLRQLLENLFRNAVEHGDEAVTVRVGPLPDGFYVEDDGPGIPDDAQEEIFEARYSTSEAGTGLGLSIVETVAEAHGWTVAVTDSEEGGARFEITSVD